MALVNTLKPKVDLPVWEWMRPCPIATVAGGTLTTADTLTHRYLYYMGATFYRYDTISDSWAQLTTPPVVQSGISSLSFTGYRGYYGRAISCPSNNTLRIAGLHGQVLKGYKIRIISGMGAGQERTITNVDEPIVWDRCVATAISTATPLSLTDGVKNWTYNQWRDYQVRIVLGTGIATRQVFKIAYNSNNTVFVADGNYQGLEPFVGVWYRAWTTNPVVTAGSQTIYQIESSDITVDTPWDILPNNTSRFCVLSGGIWFLTGGTNFVYQYYDVVADAWYTKTSQGATGICNSAVLATDVCIEKIGEWAGAYRSGSATSGSTRDLTDTTLNLTASQYINYRIRITSGSGMGQERTIISNSVNTFTVSPPFNPQPSASSAYSLFGDVDKVYWTGHANAALYKYSAEADIHALSKIYDYGCPSTLCFTWAGMPTAAQPISSITRVGTVAQVTTSFNHCLSASNMIQVFGATDPLYNITASVSLVTSSTALTSLGFTYNMTGTPGGSATAFLPALATSNLTDPSKMWDINQWSGSLCVFQSATVGTAAPVFRSALIIRNTTSSLTFLTASAAPIVLGKYAICSPIAMGHVTSGSIDPSSGFCTTVGTTTTVIDATKNWYTNQWAGYRVKFTSGTNHGSEVSITSNTNTTLTLTTAVSITDLTTTYTILGCPIKGLANRLTWAGKATSGSLPLIRGQYIFCFPGGISSQLTRYNVTTEAWDLIDMFPYGIETLTSGTQYAYDGNMFIYFQVNNTGRVYRVNVDTLYVEPSSTIPYGHSTVIIGNRLELIKTDDNLLYLYLMRNTGQEMWRTLVYW